MIEPLVIDNFLLSPLDRKNGALRLTLMTSFQFQSHYLRQTLDKKQMHY